MDQRMSDATYVVVVNDEEQYSTWPAGREVPSGWRKVGEPTGSQECLDHIREVWTDMRPKSLRVAMAGSSQAAVAEGP